MLDERFVYLTVVLSLVGSGSYVIATLRGRTRPNRVSWFVWALAPLVAFGAELGEGVGLPAVMTFMAGFGPAMVFLASLVNRHASWRITRLDLTCGVLSVIAIGLWLGADHGPTAIVLTITADALAAAPTLIKAYRHPETESSTIFWLAATGASITLMTIDTWDFAHYGFPVYILGLCLVIASLITFRTGHRGGHSGERQTTSVLP